MEKQVTSRQTCLILILVAITTKLLFLPSLLCQDVGRDAYIYIFLFMILEVGILGIFAYLTRKYPTLDFDKLLAYLFGKVFAKIVLFLYLVYFILQTSIVFQSAYVYLYENLYSKLEWYVYVFPLVITMAYVAFKGLNSIARLIEMFIPMIFVGVVMVLFLGSINTDYSNALPIMENSFFEGFVDVSKYALWFSDYLIYLVLFGNIKTHAHYTRNIIITAISMAVMVGFFILVFYCLFDYSAVYHRNAITDIMQVIPRNSDIGSLDWIVTLVWDICMIIYMCLMFFASTKTCQQTFNIKHKWLSIVIVFVVLAASVFVTKFDAAMLIQYASEYLFYFHYVVLVVIPIVMLIVGLVKHKEKANA